MNKKEIVKLRKAQKNKIALDMFQWALNMLDMFPDTQPKIIVGILTGESIFSYENDTIFACMAIVAMGED